MSTTPIIVSGACGRMGRMIIRLALATPSIQIVAGLETPACVSATDGSLVVEGTEIPLRESLAACAPPERCVLVDFSAPDATACFAAEAAALGVGIVCGTTGLSPAANDALAAASARVPVLVAANMSLGVNVLLDVARRLAATLADYDLEIVEAHHRRKKDAPSGTALALARAAAEGRGVALDDVAVYGREGLVGERPAGEIGIHAVRGGDVVGDHTMIFATDGERVEIGHRASSRETFAAGALRAAAFLCGRPAGGYTMRDVLGLD